MRQRIIQGSIINNFSKTIYGTESRRLFLICGRDIAQTESGNYLLKHELVTFVFQDFESNPTYESVQEAVKLFQQNQCDGVVAIGGGSAMDVAKCVKAFGGVPPTTDFIEQTIKVMEIPIYVIPTTAGSGSEATKFAVVYVEGIKKSVENENLLPDIVFLDSTLLKTLPNFQKKVTMMDALAHCIESYWSLNANEKSRAYAVKGMQMILEYYDLYLKGDERAFAKMNIAANNAGKAINITKTTAAHAMSYKLTKMYNIPHGHAVTLCLVIVWEYTFYIAKSQKDEELLQHLFQIAAIWNCDSIEKSIDSFRKLSKKLCLEKDFELKEGTLLELCQSVNVERLRNHPIIFEDNTIKEMYKRILEGAI